MKHLRRLRIALALFFFLGITAIFADPTHTVLGWFGWMAKLQFLPACLALSLVAVAIAAFTLAFGRLYCSVICPLGVLQDIAIRIRGFFVKRGFPAGVNATKRIHDAIRALVAAAFLSGAFLGLHFTWLAPYAIYARLASVTVAPLGRLANNQIAAWSEKSGTYFAVAMENVLPPMAVIVFSASVALLVFVLAMWKGRLWCNMVCPVGAVLGVVAKYAWLKPRIRKSKCIGCMKCERRCKARCIDVASKKIDASRCVACYDCSVVCPKGAITWK